MAMCRAELYLLSRTVNSLRVAEEQARTRLWGFHKQRFSLRNTPFRTGLAEITCHSEKALLNNGKRYPL